MPESSVLVLHRMLDDIYHLSGATLCLQIEGFACRGLLVNLRGRFVPPIHPVWKGIGIDDSQYSWIGAIYRAPILFSSGSIPKLDVLYGGEMFRRYWHSLPTPDNRPKPLVVSRNR
jgi:hypothetical protein